jgi:hypothetical protein
MEMNAHPDSERPWTIRNNAANCQLRRVISTRYIAKAATRRAAGLRVNAI